MFVLNKLNKIEDLSSPATECIWIDLQLLQYRNDKEVTKLNWSIMQNPFVANAQSIDPATFKLLKIIMNGEIVI